MTTSSSPQLLEEILRPVVEQAGLFLEEVTMTASGKTSVVRVIIDLPDGQQGSVTLDQIGTASRAVSDAIDQVPWLTSAFTLEVSSPGATRPLTLPRHFGRAIGRLLKIELTDGTKFTQRLTEVTGEQLHFENNQLVNIVDVRKAQVEVELKRLEALTDQEFGDEDLSGTRPEDHEG